MDSPRSSGHTSDHLQPPPSPYPATVDPSPVDSNGTTHTDHTEVDQIVDDYGEQAGLTPPQIEDDAQEDKASEDGMSDIRSPATDDIVSPVSQDGHAKVRRRQLHAPTRKSINVQQPLTHKLNTTVRRADSDDAPPSVIHAPDSFKQFVSLVVINILHCLYCMADVETRAG